jgi:hypothetical protein
VTWVVSSASHYTRFASKGQSLWQNCINYGMIIRCNISPVTKEVGMRYLVISDVHANLAAFEAVLEDAEGLYDKVWCLGDMVGYGLTQMSVWSYC